VTKLSTTGSAWFHFEIPNFKYKICPKSKYNLYFLHNRLEFCNQIFTQNFYILLASACKVERNPPYGNLIGSHKLTPFPRCIYAQCHTFLTTSTCRSIISITMQSLVAVLQTIPEIFRKNLPNLNPYNSYNLYPTA